MAGFTELDVYKPDTFRYRMRNGFDAEHQYYTIEKGKKVIVIIQELPGINDYALQLAQHFIDKNFTVVLPYFAGAYFHIVDDFLDLASPASGGAADGSTGTFDPILPYREVEDIPIRSCFATLQSGLIMGELMPITTEINPAKEYGIHAQQLQVEMSVGGARAHESKVVRIDCLDTSDMSFG